MKYFLTWSIWSVLLIGGCHLLMTGSPIPLWYIERLDHPVDVETVTADGLVLHDGRRIALPDIKTVPAGSTVFRKALKDGVEVQPDGEVIGLLNVLRICGNDPVVYKKLRVNLTDLAGVLNLSALQAGTLSPEDLAILKDSFGTVTDSVRIDAFFLSKMRRLRKEIEHSKETQMGQVPGVE